MVCRPCLTPAPQSPRPCRNTLPTAQREISDTTISIGPKLDAHSAAPSQLVGALIHLFTQNRHVNASAENSLPFVEPRSACLTAQPVLKLDAANRPCVCVYAPPPALEMSARVPCHHEPPGASPCPPLPAPPPAKSRLARKLWHLPLCSWTPARRAATSFERRRHLRVSALLASTSAGE